ncbi:helix-turn-helix transcriptional regulator [Microvirga soli]|uniref:helix-turn-helix transcriptional regulator n=1 Tax=Microvirga soli TaxID=1854496 RepID=UPI001FE7A25E|nr:AlpA family phage regulatory protein [Microvirga soli]
MLNHARRLTLRQSPTCQRRALSGCRASLPPNGPIPVSRSTWWAGIKDGRYPKPVKLGPRITAWRVEDIRALIAGAANER